MTSKEALNHIIKGDYNQMILTNPGILAYDGLTKGDMVKIIERDLKVLEILKRNSTRLDDEDWDSNIFNGIDYEELDEEERKVIKEWLEND